jgi:putative transposase
MTETYDPYANAVAERINGVLKQEFLMETNGLKIEVMKKIVKQTIEIYNSKRPHISYFMWTPEKTHLQSKRTNQKGSTRTFLLSLNY